MVRAENNAPPAHLDARIHRTGHGPRVHEHTFNDDTANPAQLESTLMRLTEMVARRLREHSFYARTIQLKLRYKDFTTITRAHSLVEPTQLDTEIFEQIRILFRKNWKKGAEVRLLGVHVSSFEEKPATQLGLLEDGRHQRWQQALAAADKLRDRFGEGSVGLAGGMPYGEFKGLTDDDLKAMFAYLKTLAPVKHRVDNALPPTYCKLCKQKHGAGDQN